MCPGDHNPSENLSHSGCRKPEEGSTWVVGKKGYDPHMTEEGWGAVGGGFLSAGLVRRKLDAKSGDQILSGVCQEEKYKSLSFILG